MVAAKECTNTDPKYAKIVALTTYMYKLEGKKYFFVTVQEIGVNRTQTCTNTKVRDSNKSSWRLNKPKENITRDRQDWW